MNSLKTITDEGKREFEAMFWLHRVPRNTKQAKDIRTFLDTYAEKVATEVYKAILPRGNSTHIMHRCQCGNPIGCDEWNQCRASVEQAFQTFLGKV